MFDRPDSLIGAEVSEFNHLIIDFSFAGQIDLVTGVADISIDSANIQTSKGDTRRLTEDEIYYLNTEQDAWVTSIIVRHLVTI